jgi:hypothetical protein
MENAAHKRPFDVSVNPDQDDRRPDSTLRSYKRFKDAWKEAGSPPHFIWDSKEGGRVLAPEEAECRRRRHEMQDRKAIRRRCKKNPRKLREELERRLQDKV